MARLKVLSALDTAKTQCFHFKVIIIAGMGLFTEAYVLFSIPLIINMIGGGTDSGGGSNGQNRPQTPAVVESALLALTLLGTAIGQVVFGRLGDLIGRRRVYVLALVFMVLGSLACGLSFCISRTCSLGFFRFFIGLGIGGDYPLSATIMSEFANKKTRGSFMAAVFSVQGFGILASAIVTTTVCSIFRGTSDSSPQKLNPKEVDVAWRLILMIGAIPAAMTYYWRRMMPETARYTALVERNMLQAARDTEKILGIPMSEMVDENPLPLPQPVAPTPHSYTLFSMEFLRKHGADLLACSSTWFLAGTVFYGSNLFQTQINNRYLRKSYKVDVYQEAMDLARLQAIITACSTIPGYFFSVYFIDRVGRVKIQMMGFFFMALVFFATGIPYYSYWSDEKRGIKNNSTGFVVLYGLTFFFANFGPNTTTFIIPAELFPARFRSTCHGISGAAGKFGAIIGSVGILYTSQSKEEGKYEKRIGMEASLVIFGGVCILGMLVTFFFSRETMGMSLEENEIEPNIEVEEPTSIRSQLDSNSDQFN